MDRSLYNPYRRRRHSPSATCPRSVTNTCTMPPNLRHDHHTETSGRPGTGQFTKLVHLPREEGCRVRPPVAGDPVAPM